MEVRYGTCWCVSHSPCIVCTVCSIFACSLYRCAIRHQPHYNTTLHTGHTFCFLYPFQLHFLPTHNKHVCLYIQNHSIPLYSDIHIHNLSPLRGVRYHSAFFYHSALTIVTTYGHTPTATPTVLQPLNHITPPLFPPLSYSSHNKHGQYRQKVSYTPTLASPITNR